MTGEPERGNGLPVGLERGNVLGLVPNVLAGLVTNHEVSNGIQYSYASMNMHSIGSSELVLTVSIYFYCNRPM